jgi:hypothetical protein
VGQPADWIMDDGSGGTASKSASDNKIDRVNTDGLLQPEKNIIMNLLPQGTSFTAVYFVGNQIIPLASQHAQRLGDISCRKLHCILTILSATLLGMSKNRRPVIGASVFPTPLFTQFGHRRLQPVRRVKAAVLWQSLGQRTERA